MNLGLVQTGMLWGLLALAIPFIVHLLFRQKPREVQIGSVRFLHEIMEKHRNRRRVMRWLLMSLRMVGLALLAMLFARPFMTEKTEAAPGKKFVAILIDQSASMLLRSDGNRLVDTAIDQAKALIQNADSGTRFEVAMFDYDVQPVTSPDNTLNGLRNRLTPPTESYTATDYAAALRWAHDACTKETSQAKELHIYTDLQQSGLEWSEVAPMPADVLVKVHDLGRDLPNNVAITGCTPDRLVVRPGESTNVQVSLLNAGPFPLTETPVVLEIKNGTRTVHKRQKVKLEPGSIQTVKFEMPNLESGIWQGAVRVESIDDLPFDNQRHLAIMSAPQYRVLVLDGEPNETDFLAETHFLQSALRLAPPGAVYTDSPYFPQTRTNDAPLAGFDIVIMANVEKVSQRDAERLKRFVDEGGGLIVFGGRQVSREGYVEMANVGLVPGEIVASREAFDLPWRITKWDKAHSIFQPFNDPQAGDLRRLAFRGITELLPASNASVVAEFNDQRPFVLEKAMGEKGGSLLWVTTACDSQWSRWTQSELYVPIVHQMLGHLTGLNAGGPVREALLDTNDADTVESTSPGVFQKLKSWQIVNVAPRESETERCSVDDFVNRFALNTGEENVQTPATRAAIGTPLDVRQNEIWHWILFALLTVFAAEFFVSNRTVA